MKLPKKISPNSIKDAIVEVQYASDIPFQVLVGFIYTALDETYGYVNQPLPPRKLSQFSEIIINLGDINIFYTKTIKLELRPNSLAFSCVDNYSDWNTYFNEIKRTLEQIAKIKDIKLFTRVGMRYISEYAKLQINEITKYKFNLGIKKVKSNSFAFRTEFTLDDFRIILTLQNNTPVLKATSQNDNPEILMVSTIDIDVIADNLRIDNIKDLAEMIDKTHVKEKEMFFTLLNKDFLKSLNPEY